MERNPEDFLKRKFKEKSSKLFKRFFIIFLIVITAVLLIYFFN